ncbi:MAG: DUF983 domain-containing protein [Acidimicrobiia bacterium]
MPDTGVPRERMLWWGITRRCARCGGGDLFHHWLTMKPDCPTCGLHFEREQGYFAGALAINFILTGGLLLATLVTLLVLTIPNVNVPLILAIIVPVTACTPLIFYPISKTLWIAIDRGFLQRLDAGEGRDEQYGI